MPEARASFDTLVAGPGKLALARRLLAWYRRHRRDLPWRETTEAYHIWVSEIMLQQTQVATVVPYFRRFLAAFPNVHALAAADEHDVLKLWEGLGYYRRARQMHLAARALVERHAGQFPQDLETVRTLPGIGRYTAGAIVSIAFDRPAPILEANTVRLLSRLIGFTGDVDGAAGRALLWQTAEAILPRRNCRDFNSALMELGSLVCTPRAPNCEACPIAELCRAYQQGRQDEIPRARARAATEAVREAAVVVWRGDKVLLGRRQPGQRWAGLWDFLRFPVLARGAGAMRQELLEKVRATSGLAIEATEHLVTLKHGVTRFRITLDCYQARCGPGARAKRGEWQWARPAALADFPLSTTGRKLSRLLVE